MYTQDQLLRVYQKHCIIQVCIQTNIIKVNKLLKEATSRDEVIEILKEIMEQLLDGAFMK